MLSQLASAGVACCRSLAAKTEIPAGEALAAPSGGRAPRGGGADTEIVVARAIGGSNDENPIP